MSRFITAVVTISVTGALAIGCGVSDSKKANKKAQAAAAATPSSGGGVLSAPIDVFWEPSPAGMGSVPTATGGAQGPTAWYQGGDPNNPLKTHTLEELQLVEELIAGINAERTKAGVKPLVVDTGATKAGKAHAEDMAERNYFGHVTPEGRTPEDRLKLLGVIGYKAMAENIAASTPTSGEVIAAWMKSDDHRKNMLSTAFTHLGVGVSAKGPQIVAVFLTR